MATEAVKEIELISQILNQTRELAKNESIEAGKDVMVTERLMRTIIGFLDEVRQEAASAASGKTLLVYETAVRKMDDWARNELERVLLRPRLLEERERTLDSVVKFLNERIEKTKESQDKGQDKPAQESWEDY
jgi:hypothetical protein